MERLYKCTKDFQNTDFAVGEIMSAKEWGERAYDWAYSDDWEHPEECLLENFESEQELIDFIQDFWDLEIVDWHKYIIDKLEWLESHNKNYTKEQYWKIQELLEDVKNLEVK